MLGKGVQEYCVGNRSRSAFRPNSLSPMKTLFSCRVPQSRFTSTRLTRCSQHNFVPWMMSRCFMHVKTSASRASSSTIGTNFKVTVSTLAMDDALKTTCSKNESAANPFGVVPFLMKPVARRSVYNRTLVCAPPKFDTTVFFLYVKTTTSSSTRSFAASTNYAEITPLRRV